MGNGMEPRHARTAGKRTGLLTGLRTHRREFLNREERRRRREAVADTISAASQARHTTAAQATLAGEIDQIMHEMICHSEVSSIGRHRLGHRKRVPA